MTSIHTKTEPPPAPTLDWPRITQALDAKVAQRLEGTMGYYLRDDLSERVPRTQAMFYRSGTACDHVKLDSAFKTLATRLQTAMHGEPEEDDKQLFQRGRAPLYAAFLRAEYPENKQLALAALKHQMAEAAGAYAAYAMRMAENSFPNESMPTPTVSTRTLIEAIEKPLLRAYCCMEMLRASSGEEVMGLTDNRMAIMEAFDFMKEAAEPYIRKQLEMAPRAVAKSSTPTTTINGAHNIFTTPATQPRTREQYLTRSGQIAAVISPFCHNYPMPAMLDCRHQ